MSAGPTFTLAEIANVFGTNFDGGGLPDVRRVARDAMDDAVRTLAVVYEALSSDDDEDARNLLYNAKCRLEVAITIIEKMTHEDAARWMPAKTEAAAEQEA